jgi:hypothetical protein
MGKSSGEHAGISLFFMKKILVLVILGLVGWNAFGRPEGAEYFCPSGGDGHKYIYRATSGFYKHAQNGLLSSSWGQHATLTHEQTTLLDGRFYRKMVLRCNGSSESKITYSRLLKDGIYARRSTELGAREYLELPLPPKVGKRWRYEIENEHIESEIAAIESVEAAGKTYQKCIIVKSWGTIGGMPAYSVTSYAPKVGMVRFASTVGGEELELVLSEE